MIVTGKKEYVRKQCEGCIYADFKAAQGLHPDYGWWMQICTYPDEYRCKPTYEYQQLTLF